MAIKKKYPRKRLSPLGKILTKSFKNLGLDLKFSQQKIMEQWDEIVGEQIWAVSRPHHFKFRTLFVNVSNSVWTHQLVFLEDKIKEKINRFSGKKLVQKIYFKVGELPSLEKDKSGSSENSHKNYLDFVDGKDEKEADSVVEAIEDSELKIILKRIIMKGKGADRYRKQIKAGN